MLPTPSDDRCSHGRRLRPQEDDLSRVHVRIGRVATANAGKGWSLPALLADVSARGTCLRTISASTSIPVRAPYSPSMAIMGPGAAWLTILPPSWPGEDTPAAPSADHRFGWKDGRGSRPIEVRHLMVVRRWLWEAK